MNGCACCGPTVGSLRSTARAPVDAGRTARVAEASSRAKPAPEAAELPADADPRVLTVGHSTRPIEVFLELLLAHRVQQLIDVRTVPCSRHNPQFGSEALANALATAGIGYAHSSALGGFRRPAPNSPNAGWRNLSFRGYADYMQTAAFAAELENVVRIAAALRVALMCAEAVPWRCHRSLIADALLVRHVPNAELVSPTRLQPHKLTSFARVAGDTLTYPPEPRLEAAEAP
jgi:uncharacterized protein (DUF488 family)